MVRKAIGTETLTIDEIIVRCEVKLSEGTVRAAVREMMESGEVQEEGIMRPFRYRIIAEEWRKEGEERREEKKRVETRIMEIEVERNEEVIINIRVAKEIEEFFKRNSTGIGESSNWGMNFYKVTYNGELGEFFRRVYDRYGEMLVDDRKVNIAILRTVGIGERTVTIRMKNEYSEETLVSAVKQLKEIVKEIYQKWIRRVVIRCKLEIEEII